MRTKAGAIGTLALRHVRTLRPAARAEQRAFTARLENGGEFSRKKTFDVECLFRLTKLVIFVQCATWGRLPFRKQLAVQLFQ
ncbi:hypothetical protein X759_31460 [Mesorhizobium sp. LSHC420B00]|nr:hypothetical protein X759_31460 [Mesorhizobium sp. LSHC420B00]